MRIIVDYREKASGIIELLRDQFEVEVTKLKGGDYLINNRITVERKSARDFLVSIIDLRLFKQVAHLKKYCPNPLLLIEGNPYKTDLQFDPRAIRGALLSVKAIWQVPVVFSRSIEDSSDIMGIIARQDKTVADVMPLRGGYRPKRLKSRQLYLLQGLPGVGPALARRMLLHFKSVRRIMAASVDDLTAVDGIGKTKALKIQGILDYENNKIPGDAIKS